MRILITGGFGFIGGRIGEHLVHLGHDVVLGSRSAKTPPDWLVRAKVEKTDWNNEDALINLCQGIDVVIHAAGMNANDCANDPLSALEFNGVATARLLNSAIKARVKHFIYLSTAHVYKNPLIGNITEETHLTNPHPYATSHLAGEHAVLSANKKGEIKGTIFRVSNAYGAPTHKNANCWMLLINDLCRQAVETRKLILQTSGHQQRDFISITMVCQIMEEFIIPNEDIEQSGVFNLGSGNSKSVLEMTQFIQQRCKQVLGYEPQIQRAEIKPTDLKQILHYQVNKLSDLNINTLDINKTAEIDNLLSFCLSTFIP